MLDILVVDDHPLMRAGLQCMLETAPELRVVGTAVDGAEALQLAERLVPDVVLLDLSMPGMGGMEATARLQRLPFPPVVVVLTSTCAAAVVRDAFAAGAAGYLLKETPPDQLLTALRGVAEGRPAIDPRVARILVRQQRRADEDAARPPAARPS